MRYCTGLRAVISTYHEVSLIHELYLMLKHSPMASFPYPHILVTSLLLVWGGETERNQDGIDAHHVVMLESLALPAQYTNLGGPYRQNRATIKTSDAYPQFVSKSVEENQERKSRMK
jgi:hypothetical protein